VNPRLFMARLASADKRFDATSRIVRTGNGRSVLLSTLDFGVNRPRAARSRREPRARTDLLAKGDNVHTSRFGVAARGVTGGRAAVEQSPEVFAVA